MLQQLSSFAHAEPVSAFFSEWAAFVVEDLQGFAFAVQDVQGFALLDTGTRPVGGHTVVQFVTDSLLQTWVEAVELTLLLREVNKPSLGRRSGFFCREQTLSNFPSSWFPAQRLRSCLDST